MSDALADFLRESTIDEDLTTVPGLGQVSAERLSVHGIHTTYQLFGCFLRVCGEQMNGQQRVAAFKHYLKLVDVPACARSAITHSVAEKLNIMMPGIVDSDDSDSASAASAASAESVPTNLDGVPAFTSVMEENYYNVILGAFGNSDEGLPEYKVYSLRSLDFVKSMLEEGAMQEFMKMKNGIILDDDGDLVLSVNILHNFYHHLGEAVPLAESYEIVNLFD